MLPLVVPAASNAALPSASSVDRATDTVPVNAGGAGGTPEQVPLATLVPAAVGIGDAGIPIAMAIADTDTFLLSQDGSTLVRGTMAQLAAYIGGKVGGGGGSAQSIAVSTVADVALSTSFTVSGTFSGYDAVPTFTYADGAAGTAAALSSPTFTFDQTRRSGTFSFTHPGVSAASGFFVVIVTAGAVSGASNFFQVGATVPSIPSPLYVFDASANYGMMYADTALATQTVPGASAGSTMRVKGIADVLGTGNIAVQATDATAPFLQAAVRNGMPGLRFTGSASQYLKSVAGASLPAAVQASPGLCMLVVFTPATLPNSTVIAANAFSIADGTVAPPNSTSWVKPAEFRNTGAAYANRSGTVNNNLATATGLVTANGLVKMVSRFGPIGSGSEFLRFNGGSETTAALSGADAGTLNAFALGAVVRNPLEYFLDGWLHEVRIWNTLADPTISAALSTYATTKWGS